MEIDRSLKYVIHGVIDVLFMVINQMYSSVSHLDVSVHFWIRGISCHLTVRASCIGIVLLLTLHRRQLRVLDHVLCIPYKPPKMQ